MELIGGFNASFEAVPDLSELGAIDPLATFLSIFSCLESTFDTFSLYFAACGAFSGFFLGLGSFFANGSTMLGMYLFVVGLMTGMS